jgi:cytochrome c
MKRSIVLASLFVFVFPAAAWAAADDSGEIIFNNHCRKCHTVKQGDNRLGPSLYGIVGKKAGQVEGFEGYSGGLEGITWDEATLDKFIADPASVASSTNMIYPPVTDPEERKKIIGFLEQSGGPAR